MSRFRIQENGFEDAAEDLAEAMKKTEDLSEIMEERAAEMALRVDDAFNAEKSLDGKAWKPLSPATLHIRQTRKLKAKTNSRAILKDSGLLKRGITTEHDKKSFAIGVSGPAAEYARKMQMGDPSNKLPGGKRAPIPARPYLPMDATGKPKFPEEFVRETMEMIAEHVFSDFE